MPVKSIDPIISYDASVNKAKNNEEFVGKILVDDNKEASDIDIDFLGGDLLIIDDSLRIVDYEYDSIDTSFEEIIDNLQVREKDFDISINGSNKKLFDILNSNSDINQTSIEELIALNLKPQTLNQSNTFFF